MLIVNTASKCGFTPQFAGLEELNQKYKDKGLVIIGFPCNQFKEQDPGNDSQIEEFCQLNYGVTFQIMRKTDVNGAAAEPIFEYLKAQAPTEEYNGLKAKAAKTLFKAISKSVEKDSSAMPPSCPKRLVCHLCLPSWLWPNALRTSLVRADIVQLSNFAFHNIGSHQFSEIFQTDACCGGKIV